MHPAKALEDLSARSGILLQCDEVISREIWAIQVQDVTLEALKMRLAHVAGGEWVPITGGFRLSRDSRLAETLHLAALQEEVEAIRKSQRELEKELASQPNPSDNELRSWAKQWSDYPANTASLGPQQRQALYRALRAQDPKTRIAKRIAAKFDPYVLLSIPKGQRAVFFAEPSRPSGTAPRILRRRPCRIATRGIDRRLGMAARCRA